MRDTAHRNSNRQRATLMIIAWLSVVLLACNLTTAQPTPAPTPDLPQVTVLEPANNRQIIEGTEFNIDVLAEDTTLGIARVEVRVDSTVLADVSPVESEAEQRFRVQTNWRAQGVGLHVIQAIAYRPDDTPSDPMIINIEVLPRD